MKVLGVLAAIIALSAMSASAAQATKFTSAKYPATATGTSTGDVFTAFGSSVKCTNNSFTSSSLTEASEEITIIPHYTNCTAFGTLPATVDINNCKYVFRTSGLVDIADQTGKTCTSITVTIWASNSAHLAGNTPVCILHIPKQTGLGTVSYTSNANGTLTVSGTVEKVTATQTRNSALLCPAGTHTSEAKYAIQAGGIVMTGNNGAISVD
jgi:hypothetical protein